MPRVSDTFSKMGNPPIDDEKATPSPTSPIDSNEVDNLEVLGYATELQRNRSLFTLLFQSLAIAAIPYGEGGPLISAIYGGGQLSIFVGWIVVLILDECVALSLSELASRYPTSAGPYYWSFQVGIFLTFSLSGFLILLARR